MKKIALEIIIFLLIALFIYAAASKITDYEAFQAQLGKSPLIMKYSETLAILVPASEFTIVLCLLIPRLCTLGLYGAFTLMFAFTLYITFVLTLSPYVPCSCGGILNKMGWGEHLVFNIGFTILALAGILIQIKKTNNNYLVAKSI